MKHITIKRTLREKIHKYANYNETVDETINRLLNEVENLPKEPLTKGSTSINITEDTMERLVSMKYDEKESYSSLLERIFNAL